MAPRLHDCASGATDLFLGAAVAMASPCRKDRSVQYPMSDRVPVNSIPSAHLHVPKAMCKRVSKARVGRACRCASLAKSSKPPTLAFLNVTALVRNVKKATNEA